MAKVDPQAAVPLERMPAPRVVGRPPGEVEGGPVSVEKAFDRARRHLAAGKIRFQEFVLLGGLGERRERLEVTAPSSPTDAEYDTLSSTTKFTPRTTPEGAWPEVPDLSSSRESENDSAYRRLPARSCPSRFASLHPADLTTRVFPVGDTYVDRPTTRASTCARKASADPIESNHFLPEAETVSVVTSPPASRPTDRFQLAATSNVTPAIDRGPPWSARPSSVKSGGVVSSIW